MKKILRAAWPAGKIDVHDAFRIKISGQCTTAQYDRNIVPGAGHRAGTSEHWLAAIGSLTVVTNGYAITACSWYLTCAMNGNTGRCIGEICVLCAIAQILPCAIDGAKLRVGWRLYHQQRQDGKIKFHNYRFINLR